MKALLEKITAARAEARAEAARAEARAEARSIRYGQRLQMLETARARQSTETSKWQQSYARFVQRMVDARAYASMVRLEREQPDAEFVQTLVLQYGLQHPVQGFPGYGRVLVRTACSTVYSSPVVYAGTCLYSQIRAEVRAAIDVCPDIGYVDVEHH